MFHSYQSSVVINTCTLSECGYCLLQKCIYTVQVLLNTAFTLSVWDYAHFRHNYVVQICTKYGITLFIWDYAQFGHEFSVQLYAEYLIHLICLGLCTLQICIYKSVLNTGFILSVWDYAHFRHAFTGQFHNNAHIQTKISYRDFFPNSNVLMEKIY